MLAAAALKCPHPTQEQGSPPQAPLTCAGAGVRAPAWLLQREPPPTAARGTCQGHCEAWARFPSEGAEGEEVRPLEPPRRDRTSRAVVLSAALLRSQSGLPPHLAGEAGLTCSCSAPPGGVPRGRDPWRLEVGGAAVCEGALPELPKLLPVHFKVTTRPEAHSSLRWREGGLSECPRPTKGALLNTASHRVVREE